MTKDGNAFQTRAPATGKERSPIVVLRVGGTTSAGEDVDRSRRLVPLSATRCSLSDRYAGAVPCRQFQICFASTKTKRYNSRCSQSQPVSAHVAVSPSNRWLGAQTADSDSSFSFSVSPSSAVCDMPLFVPYCTPVSEVAGRRHPRSASRQHLTMPTRYRLSKFRPFRVAGPTSWNSLPDRL